MPLSWNKFLLPISTPANRKDCPSLILIFLRAGLLASHTSLCFDSPCYHMQLQTHSLMVSLSPAESFGGTAHYKSHPSISKIEIPITCYRYLNSYSLIN